MTRVLVTGGHGQLGYDITRVCLDAGDDVISPGHAELDVTDPDQVAGAVETHRADVVINCAAWTNVDACEADPDRARLVNGLAVGNLRRAVENVGGHLVQISTDYVFDGLSPDPYDEHAAPKPMSVYGTSKLLGEHEAGSDATIVRTSWVCGEHGRNMVTLVLDLLAAGRQMRFVTDQIGNPSFTAQLAPRIRQLAVDRCAGVFHLTNSTPDDAGVSWYEFVRQIVAAAGGDPEAVAPILTAQLDPPRPAPRPANSVLANNKTTPLADYREPLHDLVMGLRRRTH